MKTVNLTLALIIVALVVAIFNLSPDISLAGELDPAGPAASTPSGVDIDTASGANTGADTDTRAAADAARRGADALASISYPWQEMLPGWKIDFHTANSGAYGYTLTREQHIDIYVRAGQSDQLLAHVVAHEIGHAIDVTLNDDHDRQRWQDQRNLDAPWWPDNRASDFATGAGDFAESFAAWQVGSAAFRSEIGTPPSGADLDLMSELAQG